MGFSQPLGPALRNELDPSFDSTARSGTESASFRHAPVLAIPVAAGQPNPVGTVSPRGSALGGSVPDQLRYAYHLVAVRLAHVSRCHVAPWYEVRALDVYRRVLDSPHSLSLLRQLPVAGSWKTWRILTFF